MSKPTNAPAAWKALAVLLAWILVYLMWPSCLLEWIRSVLHGMPVGDIRPRLSQWPTAGLAAGVVVFLLNRHPRRSLAFIPIGFLLLACVLGMWKLGADASPALEAIAGFAVGIMSPPIILAYASIAPPHWFFAALFVVSWFTIPPAVAWVLLNHVWQNNVDWLRGSFLPVVIVISTAGFAIATWVCFRELLELALEVLIWPFYRVRAHGPGLKQIPPRGPCIVIANHSAWFDPMWLAKVLPRKLIPMMTSVFYDLPVINWLMIHAAQAIRVQAGGFRRDVPELKEAVAALDRGECLVVFPEGAMRRKEEQPLRNFGQGVYHILKERPDTPVVACWIDGGWGCYFSYWNGPPTKNKKLDFWRRIEVGVSAPETIAPELLNQHRALRTYLMKACLEARRHLGKEPYQLEERVAMSEEEVDRA